MSIETKDIIDRLPFELKARAEADPFCSDIPVTIFEEGMVRAGMDRLQAAVTTKAGKRGVAIIIPQLVADDDFPNLQFGPMTLFPSFLVVEVPELNRDPSGTGKSARKVARWLRDLFKGFGMEGMIKDFRAMKPCIHPVPLMKELGDKVKCYQVDFRCLEVSTESLSTVQLPVISQVGSTAFVQIVSGTEGADVFYTLDDSYPSAANTEAKLYADPIEVPESGELLVRACAYKTGMVASWVTRKLIELES